MAITDLFFGKPPFRFLAQHLAQDADFIEDARRILNLDEDTFLRLATQLATTDTFLSLHDLAAIVSAVIGEDSDEITSIIYRLAGIVHDADMDVKDAMDAMSKAIEEKAESLEPQQRRTLIDRLRKLIVEPIGLAKQFKARQLVDAIGAELDDFRIICDIRPIFDLKHERIDGAIPLAILRLEYSKPDGESAVVELRITEKQIANFGERITDASMKLRMIKELLASQNVTIPRTKSTITEDES
jgi:hypothetical protein